MIHYLLKWEIDIYALSPESAAGKALTVQRDPRSTATIFEVKNVDTGYREMIDYQAKLIKDRQAGLEPDWKSLLMQLVVAMDNSTISSWQTTAGWQKQLDEARAELTGADK